MKLGLSLTFIFTMYLAIAQNTFVFYDSIFAEPVGNVQVFDKDADFIGISNEFGMLTTSESSFPFTVKRRGYETLTIENKRDTLFLTPTFQLLEEVKIVPVNKMELYTAIINKSSSHIDRNNSLLYGVYFEALLLVNSKSNDTIRVEKTCNMALQKVFEKKKFSYNFYCDNGRKGYKFVGETKSEMSDLSSDTSGVKKMLRIVPSFDKNFDYDLLKKKEYELGFEENQIIRELSEKSSRMKFENDESHKTIALVEYKDSLLYSWSKVTTHSKEYDGKGIFINFAKSSRQISFSDSDIYSINSIIENVGVEVGTDGVLYRIFVVKGFIPNTASAFELSQKVEKIDDYFESLEDGDELVGIYNFELEK